MVSLLFQTDMMLEKRAECVEGGMKRGEIELDVPLSWRGNALVTYMFTESFTADTIR